MVLWKIFIHGYVLNHYFFFRHLRIIMIFTYIFMWFKCTVCSKWEVDLLIDSNFFQSFMCDRKLISFQLCLLKGLFFVILSGWFLIFWWFSATVITYWKQFLLLFFKFIVAFFYQTRRIYIQTTTILTYLLIYIIHSINTVKDKIVTFH